MLQKKPSRHATAKDALEGPRRELSTILAQFARTNGLHTTDIPGLTLFRQNCRSSPACGIYQPSLILVAQGAKRALLADEVYNYDQMHYLITSVDLPILSHVTRATPEVPYLCVTLRIEPRFLAELIAQMDVRGPSAIPTSRGIAASRITAPLLDAMLRLVRLLQSPEDIPVLAPLLEREILYRLLNSEQGTRLRHIAIRGSQSHQVARAIDWLKQNLARPLQVADLAQTVSMSTSSLHHHFKSMTAMSPLQYQKQLRLQEARRLMLMEQLDAASAGHMVGYESPSQFSREYSRLYGAPPRRDVVVLRQQAE